jgi:hypothetical protein
MPAAGVVLIIAVVIVVLALVYYLVATIVALRQITKGLDEAIDAVGDIIAKTAPVEGVVADINKNLDAAVDALEGLLVKKAGLEDAVGLIDGLYPGAGAAGLRNYEGSGDIKPPRIAEVYTKGTLTLARLGREAPVAAASPNGPAIRDVAYASLSARKLYPDASVARPLRSPVIGTDSPEQYEPSPEPGIRRHIPNGDNAGERTSSADARTV